MADRLRADDRRLVGTGTPYAVAPGSVEKGGGGPYAVAISAANASRLSSLSMTVTTPRLAAALALMSEVARTTCAA